MPLKEKKKESTPLKGICRAGALVKPRMAFTLLASALFFCVLLFCVLPISAAPAFAAPASSTFAQPALSYALSASAAPASASSASPQPSTPPASALPAFAYTAQPALSYAAQESNAVEVSRDGTQARSEGIPFAVVDFLRLNKGTNQAFGGVSYGYRFPMAGANAFAVVVTSSAVIVYLPLNIIQELSIGINNASEQAAFKELLFAIDAENSSGNILLKNQTAPYLFTTEKSIERDGYTYRFAVEIEPDWYYVCITGNVDAQGLKLPDSGGAIYTDSGLLVFAEGVIIDRAPEGLDAVWEFFGGIDYRPFWVSIRTSLTAMLFVFVLGLAAAHFSMRINERVRSVLDSIFTIPMVLPPTVCGFLLLVAFGNSPGFGRWLIDHGVVLVFSWPGAVIAAFVVAFPLMYRTARGAFESLDPNFGDAARTLGWSNSRVFFRLTMPLAWPSVAAGTVLAFARALGEFGATLFIAGNFAGRTQTMPLAIYFQWMSGRTEVAMFWVVVIILISFLVILFINWYASRTQRFRKAGADIETEPRYDGSVKYGVKDSKKHAKDSKKATKSGGKYGIDAKRTAKRTAKDGKATKKATKKDSESNP